MVWFNGQFFPHHWQNEIEACLIFSYILVILFGSVIEAIWSKTLPRSENKNIAKIAKEAKSQAFPSPNKKFQNNLDKETMEKYCRFLLGAYKECFAKYLDFKLGKVQESKEKPYTQKKPSTTTSSPLIDRNEKILRKIKGFKFEIQLKVCEWKGCPRVIEIT